jgi:hypothetical protein
LNRPDVAGCVLLHSLTLAYAPGTSSRSTSSWDNEEREISAKANPGKADLFPEGVRLRAEDLARVYTFTFNSWASRLSPLRC